MPMAQEITCGNINVIVFTPQKKDLHIILEELNDPVEWNSRNEIKLNRAKSLNSWIVAISPSRQADIMNIYI